MSQQLEYKQVFGRAALGRRGKHRRARVFDVDVDVPSSSASLQSWVSARAPRTLPVRGNASERHVLGERPPKGVLGHKCLLRLLPSSLTYFYVRPRSTTRSFADSVFSAASASMHRYTHCAHTHLAGARLFILRSSASRFCCSRMVYPMAAARRKPVRPHTLITTAVDAGLVNPSSCAVALATALAEAAAAALGGAEMLRLWPATRSVYDDAFGF